jgi:hypothetical protein
MACCLKIAIQFTGEGGALPITNFELNTPTGTCLNGANYWNFELSGDFYQIRRVDISEGCRWELVKIETIGEPCGAGGNLFAVFEDENFTFKNCVDCPLGTWTIQVEKLILFNIQDCGTCNFLQERDKRKFDAIKLPEVFEDPDRGFIKCCCIETVLADGSADTWKNDVKSAWIKLSNPLDVVTFELLKDGQPTTYTPQAVEFPNEPNAFYTTIQWADVLSSDGAGCYELKVNYDISGIISGFTWGIYILKPYTIQNALKTSRVRTKFNAFQEIEGIDFTGAEVESSLRFFGMIGKRQPNTETDNLIYENREMKRVIRENLNTYEIKTDPLCEDFITQLTDLYLLSENELFISDYNAHNHSYKINDLPTILEESPEIEYFDFARDAVLTCTVGDKFKNKRTYYK